MGFDGENRNRLRKLLLRENTWCSGDLTRCVCEMQLSFFRLQARWVGWRGFAEDAGWSGTAGSPSVLPRRVRTRHDGRRTLAASVNRRFTPVERSTSGWSAFRLAFRVTFGSEFADTLCGNGGVAEPGFSLFSEASVQEISNAQPKNHHISDLQGRQILQRANLVLRTTWPSTVCENQRILYM